jgi:hypothetical protein
VRRLLPVHRLQPLNGVQLTFADLAAVTHPDAFIQVHQRAHEALNALDRLPRRLYPQPPVGLVYLAEDFALQALSALHLLLLPHALLDPLFLHGVHLQLVDLRRRRGPLVEVLFE